MSDKAERHIGTIIDGWRLEGLLGAGGNAEVWKASRNGVQAAVKFMKSAFAAPGNKRFARFRDEARMQGLLSARFPGILPLLDSSIPDEPSPDLPVWLGGGYVILSRYMPDRIGWSEHAHPIGSAAFEQAAVTMFTHLNGSLPQVLERFLRWMETGKPPLT
jgi:hypothetical protein